MDTNGCLNVVLTVNEGIGAFVVNIERGSSPLDVSINDATSHIKVRTSNVCGVDLSWVNLLDEEGGLLFDLLGNNLLIQTE